MKTYELIIEKKQPTCGGKSPKDVKLLSVTTDDPIAYVRGIEENGELLVSNGPDGEIIVEIHEGAKEIKYTFTED